jgi:hypothetical protein
MATKFPDKKTPVTKAEVISALWQAWMCYFGEAPPHKECIWLLIAQWALETGWGASMHNYNMGNAKSQEGDGFDYQYFACWEILPIKQAESMAQSTPALVKITKRRPDGMAVVWFQPEHPACRFRAFGSLLEGAIDHIHLVASRYRRAWPEILKGDIDAYARALKAQGYYTADESLYAAGLRNCYNAIAKEPFDYASIPVMTDIEKSRLQNLVAQTIRTSVDDIMLRSRIVPDEDT